MELGNHKKYSGATITHGVDTAPLVDAADYGNELCISSVPFTGDVSGKIVLCLRGSNARADKSLAVYNAGGIGMILYNASDDDNLFTDNHWVPSVHIDYTPGLAIKNYIATSRKPTAKIVGQETCDSNDHGGKNDFATGKNDKNKDRRDDCSGVNTTKWKNAPTMTIFSSKRTQRRCPGYHQTGRHCPWSPDPWPAIPPSPIQAPPLLASYSRPSPEPLCPARMWPAFSPCSSRLTLSGARQPLNRL